MPDSKDLEQASRQARRARRALKAQGLIIYQRLHPERLKADAINAAEDQAERTLAWAGRHPGAIAGVALAASAWLFRHPIIDTVERWLTSDRMMAPDDDALVESDESGD